mmetsp:Transcript_882/g.1752  ORF Transcript_882/g.1752 Transcript_882/m.1752 type:complete len:673 (-) Transcript_882:326-2344(-)
MTKPSTSRSRDVISRDEVGVAQKGVGGGRPATEELKDLGRGERATQPHDGLGVLAPKLHDESLVLEPRLLEGGEAVSREDLGPLVREVACGVAAGEDVGEGAEEPVLGQRRQDGRALADRLEPREWAVGLGVERGVVQRQVAHGELELPEHLGGGAVVLRRAQLVDERIVDGRARLPVLGHPGERAQVVGPVLHELARLLDGVPLDAADARDVALVHAREHVLQRVAALVEERLHLTEGHQRRRERPVGVGHRRRLVAHHVRHGQPDRAPRRREGARARAHLVHPRAATLLLSASEGVEEDVRGGLAAALQLEEAHVLVPHLRADVGGLALDHRHVEEPRHDAEEALEHAVEREELTHGLGVVRVLHLLELLGVVAHVPQRELPAREGLELRVLLARRAERLEAQVLEKCVRLFERGHLGREAHLGVGGAAEESRLLAPQLQDARDPRPVVVATQLGGTRDVRLVYGLAEGGVVGKSQHADEARPIEGRDPWTLLGARLLAAAPLDAAVARARRHHRAGGGRETGHLAWGGEHLGKGLGGVKHRVGEGGGESGELLLDLLEACLLLARQPDTRQLARQYLELGRTALRRRECTPRRRVCTQRAPALVQRKGAGHLGGESDHLRLHRVRGGAKRGRVFDHLQMAHYSPRARNQLAETLHRVGKKQVCRRLATC